MSISDQIREFVFDRYIEAARQKGDQQVTVRAGDVHTAMGLRSRLPAVCSALGSGKFLELAHVEMISRQRLCENI